MHTTKNKQHSYWSVFERISGVVSYNDGLIERLFKYTYFFLHRIHVEVTHNMLALYARI